MDALTVDRIHFAFLATFHYLFPQLTMGLALFIVVLKTLAIRTGDEHYDEAATFETIADLLTRAGRGEYVPTVTLPEGASFPADYRISKMGCCKAYRRRLEREPSLEAKEHRRLDTERCEEMFLSLQPGSLLWARRNACIAARPLWRLAIGRCQRVA